MDIIEEKIIIYNKFLDSNKNIFFSPTLQSILMILLV